MAALAKQSIPVATIAKRFSKTERQVEQRLALGQLDDKVLAAYVEDKIGADAIRAFTQAPSKVAQVAALEKVLKGGHVNGWTVRKALGMTDHDAGKYLELVGEEAYIKRGGKVSRDLFGSDHIVSDPGLIKAMVAELLDAKCKELVADGWKEATTVQPQNIWSYERIDARANRRRPKRRG
jgi:ParB family chromosome partitioning protein